MCGRSEHEGFVFVPVPVVTAFLLLCSEYVLPFPHNDNSGSRISVCPLYMQNGLYFLYPFQCHLSPANLLGKAKDSSAAAIALEYTLLSMFISYLDYFFVLVVMLSIQHTVRFISTICTQF